MRTTTARLMRPQKAGSPGRARVVTGLSFIVLGLVMLALGSVVMPASAFDPRTFELHRSHASAAGSRQLLSTKEDTAANGRDFFRAQTRRNYAGQDVSSEFCSYDDAADSCDWSDYAQSLSLLLMPPVVIGLFFFFLYVVVFFLRCCCIMARKCFLPWTGSSLEPWILRVCILTLAVVIGGMAVMAHVGNAWAHEGVGDFYDSSESFGSNIVSLTDDAATLLVKLDSSLSGTADTVRGEASDLNSAVKDFIDVLKKVETARFAVFLVFFIIIFGLGVSALFSICCFRRQTFCTNYCYALALFIPIFAIMAYCIGFGAAGSDVCAAYDDVQRNQASNVFTKILGDLWGANCTAMQDLFNPLLQQYNSTTDELCSNYTQVCPSTVGQSTVDNCQPCSRTSDKELLKQTRINEVYTCSTSLCIDRTPCSAPLAGPDTVCYNQSQTLEQCVTQCQGSYFRDYANETIYYIDLIDETDTMIKRVTPYVGCGMIYQYVLVTEDALCVEFIAGLFLIVVAVIVLSFVWIFFELCNLLAFERAGLRRAKDDDDGL